MKKPYPEKVMRYFGNRLSKTVIWVSMLIVGVVNYNYENWTDDYKIIAWDVNSYYAYLPMVFIHHDIDLDFVDEDPATHKAHFWPVPTPTGGKAILTTMGLSFLYAPFFLGGHLYAHLFGYETSGFSAPYQIALILSCLFYLTIGLIFLRKFLRLYFSEPVTALTLLIVVFGTNLLHYVTDEPTMSHAYNFSLISVFLFTVTRWYRSPRFVNAVITGALAGLITLIRPTNIIVILFLLLYGITSFTDLGNRIVFYFRRWGLLLVMVTAFIIVWIPQFLYWHHVSGSIFLNTYGTGGEGFFFNNPQVWHLLFSYRKGWFVYTPVMFVAILGFYFLYRKNRGLFWPVLVYLLVNTYILASWWAWWNGGSFGQRSFIDMYGLMAIPLAALLAWALQKRFYTWIPIVLVITALLSLNIFQTLQYREKALHFVMMTKKSYWAVFLDRTPPQHYWDNLVYPDYEAARKGEYYTETEIPYGLEKQLGMRGYEYLRYLEDSLSEACSHGSDTVTKNLIEQKALEAFREKVHDYYNKEK